MSPLLDKLLRAGEGRHIRQLEKIAKEVLEFEPQISVLSDVDLRGQTEKFRDQLAAGKELEELLPEAFATVREAARRTLGQRHYDVQIIG